MRRDKVSPMPIYRRRGTGSNPKGLGDWKRTEGKKNEFTLFGRGGEAAKKRFPRLLMTLPERGEGTSGISPLRGAEVERKGSCCSPERRARWRKGTDLERYVRWGKRGGGILQRRFRQRLVQGGKTTTRKKEGVPGRGKKRFEFTRLVRMGCVLARFERSNKRRPFFPRGQRSKELEHAFVQKGGKKTIPEKKTQKIRIACGGGRRQNKKKA